MADYRAQGNARVSLLPTSYIPPHAPPQHHPPPADPPPFKKIRLSAERPPMASVPHHQQLRVDTRESVNSYSKVEVLSPNPPSEQQVDDQAYRTTKDDLLKQISKVDREIALSDTTLQKLRKKQDELEQAASKPASAEEPEEQTGRHIGLAQAVLMDNRKKAAAAHAVLCHLGTPTLFPIYNQPQDNDSYHENIRKHRLFRDRLVVHVKRIRVEAEKREEALAEAYSRRAAEWARRVERIEQGQKRKAKEARNREFFEKVFPELRKQREERERFNRLGARVKSEAELDELADGLHEQEHEDKKMRALTVVPPLLLHDKDCRYIDTNRECMDMEAEHKSLLVRNVWSQSERDVFRDKYLQHPKNFGQIAPFLPRKSVQDCVRFYYLSKKTENYKQLLRKPRQRRSTRNPPRQPEPELPAGVTTRLQRSQGTGPRVESKEPAGEEAPAPAPVEGPGQPAPPDVPTATQPANNRSETSTPPPPSPPTGSSAPPAPGAAAVTAAGPGSPSAEVTPVPATTDVVVSSAESTTPITTSPPTPTTAAPTVTAAVTTSTSTTTCQSTAASTTTTISATTVSVSSPATPCPAQPATPTQPPPTPEAALTERVSASTPTPTSVSVTTITSVASCITPAASVTPTPSVGVTPVPPSVTPAPCAVCNVSGATRSVSRSRAHHYGLGEEVALSARVCDTCHTRCVASRVTRCPVAACGGPRVRAKRLRLLPPRWHDLPKQLKQPICDEFQIPSDLSKCCLACFKRITRRLESVGDGPTEPSEDDATRFRSLLKEHGTAWERMATASGKSAASLKAFYFTYRKRFQLDGIIPERPPAKGSDSDDSLISSGDTDTASAGSPCPPPPPQSRPQRPRRDEYDSSAAETADEENDSPTTKIIPVSSCPTSVPQPACTVTVVSPRNGPAPSPPFTVRDMVYNMIEHSLKAPLHTPKTLHNKVPTSTCINREPLATLSVVPASSASSAPNQATAPTPSEHKEGLVVLHVDRHQEPLLDLTVKKRDERNPTFSHPAKPVQTFRNSTEYAYRQQVSERESPTYKMKGQLRPPPKPSNPKGSITLGTPVESRFDMRRTPPDAKPVGGGSITAGTPVHPGSAEKRFDMLKRRSPAAYYPATHTTHAQHAQHTQHTQHAQHAQHSPQYTLHQSSNYPRNSPYSMEQRHGQIMIDCITSQHLNRSRERAGSPQHSQHSQHGTQHGAQHGAQHGTQHGGQHAGQTPAQVAQSQRPASVIQRHTPHYAPAAGHEAFNSLVEAAAQATALPVARGEALDKQTNHHLPTHDLRIQDRMLQRDVIAQKYHQQQQQMQYPQQVLERDRRVQQPFLDRERQMVLQNRERERVMAVMQERQAMDQHHPQMIHERHHHHHHQASVSSSESDQQRMIARASYSTPQKHRAMTPHHLERKDSNRPPSGPTAGGPAPQSGPSGPPGPIATGQPGPPADPARTPRTEGTLTAASLIDAIITHSINQNNDTRLGPVANDRPAPSEREEPVVPPGAAQNVPGLPPAHITSIKLGDLASNIITRDFCSPTHPMLMQQHHNNRFVQSSHFENPGVSGVTVSASGSGGGSGASSDEWKRREATKNTGPYLEPVSPPDNHHANRATISGRRYSVGGTSAGATPGSSGNVLTAYDYVSHRIVEVMRNETEERKPLYAPLPAHTYTYPFSALNVAAAAHHNGDGAPAAPTTVCAPAPPPGPEPAPLMSAQYEPLSDED